MSMEDTVQAHSERDIVQSCIELIDHVLNGEYGIFKQLAFYGFDFEELEKQCDVPISTSLSYFTLVQHLLLSKTTHSGGTSTWAKCRELGFNPNEQVEFIFEGESGE